MREVVYESYRRAEQASTMVGRMRRDLDDFKQFMLGLRPKQRPPSPYSDVACVNTLKEVLAAEEAKAVLLEQGFSDERGPQPLDLAALDEADARIDRATQNYEFAKKMAREAQMQKVGASREGAVVAPTGGETKPAETPSPELTLGASLTRTFRFMVQRTVPRDRWMDLPRLDDPQKIAARAVYRLAVAAASGDGERGFAIYAKWCEACALASADPYLTKTPEYLLNTPDLRRENVDLGPEDTWWTPERVRNAWSKQIEV